MGMGVRGRLQQQWVYDSHAFAVGPCDLPVPTSVHTRGMAGQEEGAQAGTQRQAVGGRWKEGKRQNGENKEGKKVGGGIFFCKQRV